MIVPAFEQNLCSLTKHTARYYLTLGDDKRATPSQMVGDHQQIKQFFQIDPRPDHSYDP